jgi:myo-inositol-1(or 4)-monophosphatase
MLDLRPRLIEAALTGRRGESENLRHEDNFLSEHDMWMHRRYRELLTPILGSFVYASEEAEPEVIGDNPDPDLCVLVDPLDTSELAVRGLLGYTHVMVYSRAAAQPVIAVVGDIFHHLQLYIGARDEHGTDRAFVITADSQAFELRQHTKKPLSESLVTNFLMRPGERFVPLSQKTQLIQALDTPGNDGKSRGRIGVDFGSVSLCHVAAGIRGKGSGAYGWSPVRDERRHPQRCPCSTGQGRKRQLDRQGAGRLAGNAPPTPRTGERGRLRSAQGVRRGPGSSPGPSVCITRGH